MACVVAAGLPERVLRDDGDRHPEHPADHAREHGDSGEPRVAAADARRDQRHQDRGDDQAQRLVEDADRGDEDRERGEEARDRCRRRRCGGWARCSPVDSTVRERSAPDARRHPHRAAAWAGAAGPHRGAAPPARRAVVPAGLAGGSAARLRLRLDRPPDHEVQVHDRDLEHEHHEDELPPGHEGRKCRRSSRTAPAAVDTKRPPGEGAVSGTGETVRSRGSGW